MERGFGLGKPSGSSGIPEPALRRRHFRFVTVPRLLLDNPAPRTQKIAAVIGTGG